MVVTSWFGVNMFTVIIIMPPPHKGGSIINCPRLSVRPSVCGVPQHNWKTERSRKPKFGRMEAHHTGNQWTYLEVKVTRLINAHTVNVQYLPNGRAYERQIWYTDAARGPTSATSTVTLKVKVARSRDASDRCWLISRERNVLGRP